MTGIVPADPAWTVEVAPGVGSTYTAPADGYLELTGGYAAAPDFAGLDGADTSTWVLFAPDDWSTGVQQSILGHWGAAPQRSYLTRLGTTGLFEVLVSSDGTASTTAAVAADEMPDVVNGEPLWLRVDRVAATGAVTYYAAGPVDDPTADFEEIGADVLLAGTSPAASTAALIIGARDAVPPAAGTQPLHGKVYAVRHYVNGVLVASPDYRGAAGGGASITDAQGNTFTNYGGAAIVGEVTEESLGAATLESCLLTVAQTSTLPAALLTGTIGGTPGEGSGTGGLGVDWSATGGLATFHTAVTADEAVRVGDIALFGDSITEGALAGAAADSWAARLIEAVRAAAQPAGVAGGAGFQRAWHNVGTSGWDPWTRTGGTELSDSGLGLKAYQLDTPGASMVATTFEFTTLDVVYRRLPGGGPVDVTVDGVTTTFDLAGADASGQTARVGPFASGVHTVEIENVAGVNVIEGVMLYDGDETRGFRLWNGGHGGFRALDFAKAPTKWADSLAAIPNPVLAVIMLGINDYNGGRTAEQVASNVASIVAVIRSVVPGISIVVVSMYQDGVTTRAYPWDGFEEALEAMVHGDGTLNLFDLRPRVGDYAEFYTDGATVAASDEFTSLACDFTGVTPGTVVESDMLRGGTRVLPAGTTVEAVLDAHTVRLTAAALQTATGLSFILERVVNPHFADGVHPDASGHAIIAADLAGFVLP